MNYSFYFDQTKNRCTCKIKFSGRKLNNNINYNSGCTAVLDTGAYMSSMSVNSMVMLTGKSCEEIIEENKDEIYDNICKTASGQGLKGTPYSLENLIINGFYFKKLNFLITYCASEVFVIGMDFIQACNKISFMQSKIYKSNKDIILHDFDEQVYNSYFMKLRGDLINRKKSMLTEGDLKILGFDNIAKTEPNHTSPMDTLLL